MNEEIKIFIQLLEASALYSWLTSEFRLIMITKKNTQSVVTDFFDKKTHK